MRKHRVSKMGTRSAIASFLVSVLTVLLAMPAFANTASANTLSPASSGSLTTSPVLLSGNSGGGVGVDIPLNAGGGAGGTVAPGQGALDRPYIKPPQGGGKTPPPDNTEQRNRNKKNGSVIMIRTTTTWSSHAKCGPRTITTASGGYTQPVIGHTVVRKTRHYYQNGDWTTGNLIEGRVDFISENVTCHYEPAFRDSTLTCVTRLTLGVEMRVPQRKTIYSQNVPTVFSTNPTLANCYNSTGSVNANVPVTEMGRYLGTGYGYGKRCYLREYTSADPRTGITPGDELVNCGGEVQIYSMSQRAQIDCTGGYLDWRGSPSWTMTECNNQETNNPTYQCVVGNTVKVNGTDVRSTQLKRDGSVNTLQWATPRLSGNNIVSYSFNGTTMKRSGTPWISGKGASGNLFELGTSRNGGSASLLTRDDGSAKRSGAQTTWYGRWYAASNAGEPTVLQPTYHFDAVARVTTFTITAINTETGAWTITPTHRDIPTVGTCRGPAVSVETLKVVNDVN